MPLLFHPERGIILICDFSTGFIEPEMVKVRPVVSISPRRRKGHGIVSIVPLNSTALAAPEVWHHQLSAGAYPPARGPMWAKCDLVASVALACLDRIKLREPRKPMRYVTFAMPPADLDSILQATARGLGLA